MCNSGPLPLRASLPSSVSYLPQIWPCPARLVSDSGRRCTPHRTVGRQQESRRRCVYTPPPITLPPHYSTLTPHSPPLHLSPLSPQTIHQTTLCRLHTSPPCSLSYTAPLTPHSSPLTTDSVASTSNKPPRYMWTPSPPTPTPSPLPPRLSTKLQVTGKRYPCIRPAQLGCLGSSVDRASA